MNKIEKAYKLYIEQEQPSVTFEEFSKLISDSEVIIFDSREEFIEYYYCNDDEYEGYNKFMKLFKIIVKEEKSPWEIIKEDVEGTILEIEDIILFV